MKRTKELNTNKGITLIALVITIIVMLILVAVTISMAINGGLFNYAGKAAGETKNVIANESEGYDKYVQDMLIKYGVEEGPVTNPYEADGWEYAWTCTEGVWSEIINKGETAEGDVVAKFYKTGNKAPAIEEIGLPEGDEYHLIIEGQGNMGDMSTVDDSSGEVRFNAWKKLMGEVESEETIPMTYYTTEIIVCDGITNVPVGFAQEFMNLKKIILGNSVKVIGGQSFYSCYNLESVKILGEVSEIGSYAFLYCSNLVTLELPSSVEIIGDQAFGSCEKLTNITIPNNVENIGKGTFNGCTSLMKVKMLTTDYTKLSIDSNVFLGLPEGSKIYVLSEEMKTKLEGTYDSAKTTVEVVTLEEMNQI